MNLPKPSAGQCLQASASLFVSSDAGRRGQAAVLVPQVSCAAARDHLKMTCGVALATLVIGAGAHLVGKAFGHDFSLQAYTPSVSQSLGCGYAIKRWWQCESDDPQQQGLLADSP